MTPQAAVARSYGAAGLREATRAAWAAGAAPVPLGRTTKRPVVRGWLDGGWARGDDFDEFWSRFSDLRPGSVGVVPAQLGACVLDIDVKGGERGLESWAARVGRCRGLHVAETDSGGFHVWAALPAEGLRGNFNGHGTYGGIDYRCARGQVKVWPGRTVWRWSEHGFEDCSDLVAEMFDAMPARKRERAEAAARRSADRALAPAPVGPEMSLGDRLLALRPAVDWVVEWSPTGHTVRPDGGEYRMFCPMHHQTTKSPALTFTAAYGGWCCHGSCDDTGDLVALFAHIEGLSIPDACRELHRRYLR